MKPIPLSLLLLAAACSSDVDLQLDLEGTPVQPAPDLLEHLDWAETIPGSVFDRDIVLYDIDWAPDGSLVALVEETNHLDARWTGLKGYSSDGELLWQVTIETPLEGTNALYFADVVATADGPLVVGVFQGEVDLGGGPIEGGGDLNSFLAAYDPAGALLSVRLFPGIEIGGLLALADRGVVIKALDGVTGCRFVERFDAAGTSMWRLELEPGRLAGALLVRDGKLLLSGSFEAPDALPGHPTGVVSAVSLADGRPEWTTTFELASEQSSFGGGQTIATEEGHLLVSGTVSGVVKAGPFELSPPSERGAIAVVEMDLDGNVLGVREIAGDGWLWLTGIALIADHLAVVGHTDRGIDGVDLGKGRRVNGGFVAIVDPAGGITSAHSFGSPGDRENLNQTWDVKLGPDDRLAIAGRFTGVADLGDGPVDAGGDPSNPGLAAYIAVYEPDFPSVD